MQQTALCAAADAERSSRKDMKLQTDPEIVARLAAEREDANWRFRSFLKGVDLKIEELDAIVHEHYQDVASRIDCCACANCCREMVPTLTDEDVSRLATHQDTTPEAFVAQYLTRNEDGDLIFSQRPCPFLSGNRCLVYECRPDTCRSYPHLQKKEFVYRLIRVVDNCSICPIVFNVYEGLKAELWHEPDEVWEEDWV